MTKNGVNYVLIMNRQAGNNLKLHLVFRSRGVASVTAKASFNPDKINIFNKLCDINGRKLSCFNTNLCFSAAFRPKNPVGPIGKSD